jgi:alkylated DNA repair dioxygenase AlkB
MVEQTTGKNILYGQLNYYRNGDEYIGDHVDKEIMAGDIIASISLGATRRFRFRPINKKDKRRHTMMLKNGSLLIMDENSGKHKWKHALPKMKNVGERINITFRPR